MGKPRNLIFGVATGAAVLTAGYLGSEAAGTAYEHLAGPDAPAVQNGQKLVPVDGQQPKEASKRFTYNDQALARPGQQSAIESFVGPEAGWIQIEGALAGIAFAGAVALSAYRRTYGFEPGQAASLPAVELTLVPADEQLA